MIQKIVLKYRRVPIEVKSTAAYTLCNILQNCLSFITLPLFTRLLTTAQYGQYTVYSSWNSLLAIFVTLNLAYGTFQTAMVKFKDKREEYTSAISGLFVLLGTIFFCIYFLFYRFWNKVFELPMFLIIFMLIEIMANAGMEVWLTKNRFEYKYKSVIVLTLTKAFASPLLAFLLVTLAEEKGYARIIGYASVNIIFGLGIMFINFAKGKTFYNKIFWGFALKFNIPLIPYYVSQMVFDTSDRLMISYYCGTDKAGIYGVAYSLAIVLNFVINAINSSFGPWFFEKLEKGMGERNKSVSINLAIIVALGLWGIIAIAPEFIRIMAGTEYVEGIWAVPPVVASVLLLFYAQFFSRVLFFFEKKFRLILGCVVPAMINLLFNYLFIPKYGFISAAYTTLASYIVLVIIDYVMAKRTLSEEGKITILQLYDVKKLLILFIVFCIVSVIMMLLYNTIIIRYSVIVAAIIAVLFHYKEIINLCKEID